MIGLLAWVVAAALSFHLGRRWQHGTEEFDIQVERERISFLARRALRLHTKLSERSITELLADIEKN